jgi:hypothetical protein
VRAARATRPVGDQLSTPGLNSRRSIAGRGRPWFWECPKQRGIDAGREGGEREEGDGEMRKFLLSVAIAGLMIGSAHAGTDTNWPNRWVKFGEISIYTYYYDNYDNVQKKPSTKMPNGNRTIRVLVDIPLPDGETRQVFDGVPAQNGVRDF